MSNQFADLKSFHLSNPSTRFARSGSWPWIYWNA